MIHRLLCGRKPEFITISLIIFTCVSFSTADIPYVGYEEGRYLGNIELIGCLEIDKNSNPVSTLLWIGYAYVYPFQGENSSHGYESAVEVRLKKKWGHLSSHLFLSSYFGFGNMYLIEYYNEVKTGRKKLYPGFSGGIKGGYNFTIYEWKLKKSISNISLEPYTGISISNGYGGEVNNPLITLGLRIVSNIKLYVVKPKKSRNVIPIQIIEDHIK